MRVLVTGDRNWNDGYIVSTVLTGLLVDAQVVGEGLVIIDGKARGADTFAGEWYGGAEDGIHAIHEDVQHERYSAKWDEHGKAAGPIRNQQMLTEGKPDVVIAFHDNLEASKGTADMVKRARRAGLPVYNIRRVP